MKYKIQGVGIDTTTLDYSPLNRLADRKNIGYVLTNPAANNDFIIKDYLSGLLPDTKLLTEINYVDGVDDVLGSHLKALGRKKIDLLFMNSNIDYTVFDTSVADIKKLGVVGEFGLSHPENLNTLTKNVDYLRAIGIDVTSVLLKVSPVFYQKDILEYCDQSGLIVYSCNSFGGYYESRDVVPSFSAPYLLNFAGCYSDVVLLSSRDMFQSSNNATYLKTIIGEHVENENIYLMTKSSIKISPKLRKHVSTALEIEGMVLPYNSPEFLFNPGEIKLAGTGILPEIKRTREMTDTEAKVEALIPEIYKTPGLSDDDYFVSLRYKIEDFLEITHPGWNKEIIKVTDKVMYLKYTKVVQKKKWYGKIYTETESTDTYLLFYSDGIVEFRETLKKKKEKV